MCTQAKKTYACILSTCSFIQCMRPSETVDIQGLPALVHWSVLIEHTFESGEYFFELVAYDCRNKNLMQAILCMVNYNYCSHALGFFYS